MRQSCCPRQRGKLAARLPIAVHILTVLSFTLVPALAASDGNSTNATPKTWTASSGFSSVQGSNQWFYKEWTGSNYNDLKWDSRRWIGTHPYTRINRESQHPDGYDSARVWVAPEAGTIQITGNIHKGDSANGGDGVTATVLKNSAVLWGPQPIDADDHVGYNIDVTTKVRTGDSIYFRLNCNRNASNDSTYWSPTIELIAPAPFWQTRWFFTVVVITSSGIGLTGITAGLLLRAQQQRRLARLELQRVREAERARIARDLHDDLGSGLTEVSMLAAASPGTPIPVEKLRERLERIAARTHGLVLALDEIVWAVDPAKDTLPALAKYLAGLVEEYLSVAGIACRVQLPTLVPTRPLPAGARHHLFLAVKEALNNAIRHSGASEIVFRLELPEHHLVISLTDNGRGFDPASSATGNGLGNLRERMTALGGGCDIHSQPGTGTTVTFTLPLPTEVPA